MREKRRTGLTTRLPTVDALQRSNGEWVPAIMNTVADFIYLGSKVQGSARTLSEITHRIVIANSNFQKHLSFWGNKSTSLVHIINAYKMYVISTAMHGFEGWHLDTAAIKKLNGFEIRMQSRITGFEHEVIAHKRDLFHLASLLSESQKI